MPIYQTPYRKIKPKISGPYTAIYLIRHCHPDYSLEKKLGDEKLPLSPTGIKQRQLLITKKLIPLKIDKIYASELTRAIETAAPLAEKINKNIIIDKRLNEIDWRNWYKIPYFNMTEKTRIKKVQHYRILDKKLNKMQAKGRRLITDLWEKSKRKKVAVFCHGNLIRSIVTGILNTDVIGFLSMEIYQSSVTKLVIDKQGFIKINYINSICHLPKRPKEDMFTFAINQ